VDLLAGLYWPEIHNYPWPSFWGSDPRELFGNAELTTLQSDLRLEALIDKLGHIRWRGVLRQPGPIPEEWLEFWIEDDQTSLSRIIGELDRIIADAQSERNSR
jgi:hypothetical protein